MGKVFLAAVLTALLAGAVRADTAGEAGSVQNPTEAASQPAAVKVAVIATPADVRKLFDQGRYQETLVAVTRVLEGPPGFDRAEMFLIRAECLIQTHQLGIAAQVLDAIAADATRIGDKKTAARAGAMRYVLRVSPGGMYTPKTTGDKRPINIIDLKTRMSAYPVIFAEQLPMVSKEADAAASGTTLAPVLAVSNAYEGLRYLEIVNTGKSSQTDPIGDTLAQAALATFTSSLDSDDGMLMQCADDATQTIQVINGYEIVGNQVSTKYKTVPKGLTPGDEAQVEEAKSSATAINRYANMCMAIFNGRAADFRAISLRAGVTANHASILLNGRGIHLETPPMLPAGSHVVIPQRLP